MVVDQMSDGAAVCIALDVAVVRDKLRTLEGIGRDRVSANPAEVRQILTSIRHWAGMGIRELNAVDSACRDHSGPHHPMDAGDQ